jgi:hypothetical protein
LGNSWRWACEDFRLGELKERRRKKRNAEVLFESEVRKADHCQSLYANILGHHYFCFSLSRKCVQPYMHYLSCTASTCSRSWCFERYLGTHRTLLDAVMCPLKCSISLTTVPLPCSFELPTCRAAFFMQRRLSTSIK